MKKFAVTSIILPEFNCGRFCALYDASKELKPINSNRPHEIILDTPLRKFICGDTIALKTSSNF